MYIDNDRVPIELPNGKIVLANISVSSPKLVYYKNYIIELRTFCRERNKLADMYEYIKNSDYIANMTDIYDLLDEGKLFDYVMNNDFDRCIQYICFIVEHNDHVDTFNEYFSSDNDNNTIIVDSVTKQRLIIEGYNEESITLELGDKSYKFDVELYEKDEYKDVPIKHYFFTLNKSARN